MANVLEVKLGKDWYDCDIKGEGLDRVIRLRLAHCKDGQYWGVQIGLEDVRYISGLRDDLPDGTYYHVQTWNPPPLGLVFDHIKVTGEIEFEAAVLKPLPADTAVALRLYECQD